MRAVLAFHVPLRGGSFVDYLGVDRASWRQGIASQLLETLENPVTLLTKDFSKAEHFFRRRGFTHEGAEAVTGVVGVGARAMVRWRSCHTTSSRWTTRTWSDLKADEKEAALAMVAKQQKVSKRGAGILLATHDSNVYYIVVP